MRNKPKLTRRSNCEDIDSLDRLLGRRRHCSIGLSLGPYPQCLPDWRKQVPPKWNLHGRERRYKEALLQIRHSQIRLYVMKQSWNCMRIEIFTIIAHDRQIGSIIQDLDCYSE